MFAENKNGKTECNINFPASVVWPASALPAGREPARVFSQPIFLLKSKNPNTTVRAFVVWAGIPAGRQAGNQLMCFHNQHSFQNQKTPTLLSGFPWCGPGSNRRHKDFQSFALPTELPHHSRTPMKGERGANIRTCGFIQILSTVFLCFYGFCLKLTIPRRTRKGNHIADIRHARYKLHHPLKTQSKASMWHRSIAARI